MAGHDVRASLRSREDAAAVARIEALGPVEVVAAQLESEASLRAAMEGIEGLVHAAAIYQLFAPGRDAAIVSAETLAAMHEGGA